MLRATQRMSLDIAVDRYLAAEAERTALQGGVITAS